LQKIHGEKVGNKKFMEKWVFDFYFCEQKFSAHKFAGVIFEDSRSALNLAFFDNFIKFLPKNYFWY
jgi:hypothetical protein